MALTRINVFFSKQSDAQTTLNELTEAGLSVEEVSMIMLDEKSSKKKIEESYDENDEMVEDIGVIEPIDVENADLSNFIAPGIGEIVVAGPLGKDFEDYDLADEVDKDPLYNLIASIEIEENDIPAIKQRIKNGEILMTISVEEGNEDEIVLIFSDNGGDLIDKLS